jgi:Kef-type K+ transport system membrane component KefB
MTASQAHILLILALGVFLAPPLAARVGMPAAVGEMIFGAIAVALVPTLRHLPSFAAFLRSFGFLLVLFLAGMELDTRALFAGGAGRFLRALPFGLTVPLLAMLGAVALRRPPVLGLIVGTISIGLSSRLLADMGLLRTRLGQVAVVTGGIGEIVTIVSITVITDTTHGGGATQLALSLAKLGAIFLIGLVVFSLLRDLAWWHPGLFARLLESEDSSELGMRSALALLAGFAAVGSLLHLPDALGAFVAGQTLGVLLPLRGDGTAGPAAALRTKLRAIGFAFFVPIAFITVGQELDFGVLTKPGPFTLGIAMTVASGATRLLAMPLLRLQVEWDEALLVAIVLSESLTMKVTVAQLAVSTHVMSAATLTPAVAATTAGDIIFPVLFRWLMRRRTASEGVAAAQAPSLAGPPGGGGPRAVRAAAR